jgi:hypothetical protein
VERRAPKAKADRRAPRLRLSRKRLRGHRMLFTARATDGSGIARLEIRIDGHRVRTTRKGKLRYRWLVRRGRHRVVVVAYDKKGNRATYRLSLRIRA